jgi:hypothetical protein
MTDIFNDIIWMCNARSKGVEYANLEERVRRCENEQNNQPVMSVTFFTVPKRPRRLIRRHRP